MKDTKASQKKFWKFFDFQNCITGFFQCYYLGICVSDVP